MSTKANKAVAKKTSAKKAPTTKTAATKTAPVKKAAAAKKTPAKKTVAKKATVKKAAPRKPSASADSVDLPIREGEEPWTAEELAEVRAELEGEITRLADQIELSESELVGLLRDGNEGAGRDPADVGSTNFERDHEMSLANNARDLLVQTRLALRHIAAGTYGICDNCGRPIGKGRLQAFPRATLCMECKQREERR